MTRPKIRWWLPLAPLQREEIERELQDIADAGFSGVEILGTPLTPPMSPEKYGFATPAWNQAMREILTAAKARGLTVDFTIGAVYPAATPALAPDDLATSQELVYGSVEFEGAFNGGLPEPVVAAQPDVKQRRLVGVSVARLAAKNGDSIALEPDSLRDITDQVRDGRLRWQAAAAGRWIMIASYARSAGHIVPNVTQQPARVVDHFSAPGTEAIIRLWDQQLLTPEIRALVREVGGDVFEDSLHLSGFTLWTDALLKEFERRRGYSLRPYLPVLYIAHLNEFFYGIRGGKPGADLTVETAAAFELANGEARRIRNDYYQVLSELYTEHHLQPLRAWFNQQGLRYRVQTSYGQSLEGTAAAAAVDVPETESFQLNDMIDGYRVQAAVAHLAGQRVYSTECCAVMGGAHALGWLQTLWHVHRNYAGGVNQAVLHGYSYLEATNATWPGWFPFDQMFSENYGRQPTWRHVRDFTDALGREQLVLRQGEAKIDVAIYRLSYWDYGRAARGRLRDRPEYFNDAALARAGYSYEFLSPALLERPTLTIEQRTLAPEGPGYRALVLDHQRDMPAAALRRIISLATQGLPVVIIGEPPTQEPFHVSNSKDAEIRQLGEQLKRVNGVRSIATRAALPTTLSSMSIEPAVKPQTESELLSVRRVDGDRTYLWLFNPGKSSLDTQVSLAGSGASAELDVWSGCIRPLNTSVNDGGRIRLPVRLAPGETRVVANGPLPASDQERCRHEVPTRVQTMTLGPWTLQVESWHPGATAIQIDRPTTSLDIQALRPWSAVPQFEDASGIGTYRSQLTLPEFQLGASAILRLGELADTARVFVNGKRAYGMNPYTLSVEIGPYLRRGNNEITVEVATTLRNRMRVINEQQRQRPRQPYGLLGPVTLDVATARAR